MNIRIHGNKLFVIGIIFIISLAMNSYLYFNSNSDSNLAVYGYVFFNQDGMYTNVPVNITTHNESIQLWTPKIENTSSYLFTNIITIGLSGQKVINFSVAVNNQIYTSMYEFDDNGVIKAIFILRVIGSQLYVEVNKYPEDAQLYSILISTFLPDLTNISEYFVYGVTIGFVNLTKYSLYSITAGAVNSTNIFTSIYLPYLIQGNNYTNLNGEYRPYAKLVGISSISFPSFNITVSNGLVSKSIIINTNNSTAYELDIVPNGSTFQLELLSGLIN